MSLLPARGRTWIPLVLLLIVWAVALVITHPIGNFPLDDDWCFAQSAQTLASHGDLRLPWCAEATLVTHVAWGGLFVSLSHFSFNVLRLSTYAIAALGMIAVWRLVIEVGGSAGTATLATAAFAFNPVVFLLTNTFMTDVPFAAWSAVSALCLVRALKRPTTWAICLAAATSVTATLLRQPGLFLPLMFAPAYVIAHGRSRRSLLTAAIPILVVLAVFAGYQTWISETGRRGAYYARFVYGLNDERFVGVTAIAVRTISRLLNIAFHASWYALPIVLWTQRRPDSARGRRALGVVVALGLAAMFATGKVGPWSVSLLYDLGLGPIELRGADLPSMPMPHAPHVVWQIFTLAAVASAILGLARAAAFVRRTLLTWRTTDRVRVALAVMSAGVLALTFVSMALLKFYDRYLLFLIPLFAVLCIVMSLQRESRSWPSMRIAALAVIAIYAIFAVVATHDYFEWNRARWHAIDGIVASGQYATGEIDGGGEFVQWKLAQPEQIEHPRIATTMGELPGFRTCRTYPFTRWMPPRQDLIFVVVPIGDACPALQP